MKKDIDKEENNLVKPIIYTKSNVNKLKEIKDVLRVRVIA